MKTKNHIYMDHAATTPIHTSVLSSMLPYFGEAYGNPSSLYLSGRRAKAVIDEAKERIAHVLMCLPEELIFTGSGTESDNLAILGAARAYRQFGNHVLLSSIEHKAVLASGKQLEKEGFNVEYIPVDEYGMVEVEEVMKRITDDTILVSVMYANNEIGTIQPIQALGKAIAEYRKGSRMPLFHTDACQAAGYLPLHVGELGVDLMTINGSKIYGPKGIGLLYKKNDIQLDPIVFGGGQEHGMRSGTENLPYIVGLSEALLRVESKRKEENNITLQALRDHMLEALQKEIPDMVLNGHPTLRLPNNIHISIPCVEGESMVLFLDNAGICASTGSACSSKDLQVSHVLTAIKQDPTLMHGSLRFSLGESTTKEDCEYCVQTLSSIVRQLRAMSPLTLSSL